MSRVILLMCVVSALAALGACGKGRRPGVVACSMSDGAGRTCDELEAASAALDRFDRMCSKNLHGTPSRGPCPRDGALGGCTWRDDANGAATTHWFYAGGSFPDAAAVRAHCTDQAWDFVAP